MNPQYTKGQIKKIVLKEGLLYAIQSTTSGVFIHKKEHELRDKWIKTQAYIDYLQDYNSDSEFNMQVSEYGLLEIIKNGVAGNPKISEKVKIVIEAIQNNVADIISILGLPISEYGTKYAHGGTTTSLWQKFINWCNEPI